MYPMNVRTVTEVREHFSEYLDDVIRKSPQVMKRHRDSFITMSPSHVDILLDNLVFTLTYDTEADGSLSGSLEEIGISSNAPDLQALKETLADYLLDYAEDYLSDFTRYLLSPNRRAHFPFIMKAVAQTDKHALTALFKHA